MDFSCLQTLHFLFTPTGFVPDSAAQGADAGADLTAWTEQGGLPALYAFGLRGDPKGLTPSGAFLYRVAQAFFRKLTDLPELELVRQKAQVPLEPDAAEALLQAVPFVPGAEHVTGDWLAAIFQGLQQVFAREISAYKGTVSLYLTEQNQNLHIPERVFFHLVENREDKENYPFAFLATYATKTKNGTVAHVPLRHALTEYRNDRKKLLALLSCLNRAAEVSPLIARFMETGELFHPLRLTADEAYEFLRHVERIEAVGILCRIPNWWKRRASSVSVSVKLGEEAPSMLGFDSILSMRPSLTVDGIPLTKKEVQALLRQTEGLAMLKGRWVEVDHNRLQALLKQMDRYKGSLSLMEALRFQLGEGVISDEPVDVGPLITNGQWLAGLLRTLRQPRHLKRPAIPDSLHAQLRPYQEDGYAWLLQMDQLGFGACLADDMGLGKTVQVLAYLEQLRTTRPKARVLLVVPASLLSNWQKERVKFAPDMDCMVLHGQPTKTLAAELGQRGPFLTVTTYGMVARLPGLRDIAWDSIILDEAQAIKNPGTGQTRHIKELTGRMRIAMTGTPIENDLTNLWSLFDFLNKGLLGTSGSFKNFTKDLKDHPEQYTRLRTMVSPFLLRRLKTDKSLLPDLPEKLETVDYAELSKKQTVLYRKAVDDLARTLQNTEGMERRGLVLSAITRLKQICNHPDQYLGQKGFNPEESGKFALLRELCETIYEKRERVLVFTQYREITAQLATFLRQIFHADGYVLHGGTPVGQRGKLVDAFQGELYVPFLVLSVRAGGTGLNLTKANHVIHFDRWWNPAVEDQATDRSFRIGQQKNVMVHKLVSRGTIEEKINDMIASKRELAGKVIGEGETWITELNNDELLRLLRLDP